MASTIYGVRVNEREFALAMAHLEAPHIIPEPHRAKAAWIVEFCRNFPGAHR